MRIAFIVDIHDNPKTMDWLAEAVKQYDMVAVGGDIGELGLLYKIVDFAVGKQVFIVLGNHDYPIEEMFAARSVLHGTSQKVGALTIGGIGGSLPVYGGPLELDETELLILARNLGPVDILVAHQPPIDTNCDIVYDGLSELGAKHIGSVAIKKYIEETQPLLALVGHIHESPGVDTIGRTVIVNPGPFMTGNYAEVEFEKGKVPKVELKKTRS